MKELINCGTLKAGLGFSPILCDPLTGDLIYDSDLLGKCIMSNLSMTDPQPMDDEVLVKMVNDNDLDGIIVSSSCYIELKGDTAEYYNYDNLKCPAHVVVFDLDTEYVED